MIKIGDMAYAINSDQVEQVIVERLTVSGDIPILVMARTTCRVAMLLYRAPDEVYATKIEALDVLRDKYLRIQKGVALEIQEIEAEIAVEKAAEEMAGLAEADVREALEQQR